MITTVLRQHGHRNGSGALLARTLGVGHASPESTRRSRGDRFVINWGVTSLPRLWRQRNLSYSNTPEAIARCVNKADCLYVLEAKDVECLEWSQTNFSREDPIDEDDVSPDGPQDWLREDGKIVVRTVLNGHSGAGIRIVREGQEIPAAPLYTRYFKKDAEYRVHVAYDNVILVQQKRRGENYAQLNDNDRDRSLIRTNGNGWVFCISDLDCDTRNYRGTICDLALRAARAVGINHGAVDILVKHRRQGNDAVVCEINTAPALGNPSTLNAYVQVFRERIQRNNS